MKKGKRRRSLITQLANYKEAARKDYERWKKDKTTENKAEWEASRDAYYRTQERIRND